MRARSIGPHGFIRPTGPDSPVGSCGINLLDIHLSKKKKRRAHNDDIPEREREREREQFGEREISPKQKK